MRLEELSDKELADWQQSYQKRKVVYLGTLAVSVPALALLCSMLLFQIEDDKRDALLDRVVETVAAGYLMGASEALDPDFEHRIPTTSAEATPQDEPEPVLPEVVMGSAEPDTALPVQAASEVVAEAPAVESKAKPSPEMEDGESAPSVPMDAQAEVSTDAMVASVAQSPEPEPLPSPIVDDKSLLNPEGMSDLDHLVQQDTVDTAELFGLGVRTIVIDPGHGGRDPGAIGPNGALEKNLVLSIAKRLKKQLEKRSDLRVILTRHKDVKLGLRQRVNIALEHQADLFVSLHLNTLPQKNLSIVETYYFGADKNKASLELAARENANSDYGVAEFKQLIDQLGNTVKQQESKSLASEVQTALHSAMQKKSPKLVNIGIKKAPFVVLLGAGVPSILVEATCLSNSEEAKRLLTDDYQNTIAGALSKGILSYVQANGGARYAKKSQ